MSKRYFVIEMNNGVKYCGYGSTCFGPRGDMGIKFDFVFSVNKDNSQIISPPQKSKYIFTIDYDCLIIPQDKGYDYIKEMNKKFNLNIFNYE